MQVGLLVDAEVDLAALDVLYGLGHIRGDGAGLGVGHQATRAQHTSDPADLGHLIRGGNGGVEIQEATLDLLDEVVAADHVSAGGDGLLCLLADGEHRDPGGLTGAVRQADGAAHHLVGLARVHTEADRDLNGGVLLLRGRLLGQLRRLKRGVKLVAVDLLGGFLVCLAVLAHCGSNLSFFGVVVLINAVRASAHRRAEAGPSTSNVFSCERSLLDRAVESIRLHYSTVLSGRSVVATRP